MSGFKKPGDYKNIVNMPTPAQTIHLLFLYHLCSNGEAACGLAGSQARREVVGVGNGTRAPILETEVLGVSLDSAFTE